MRISTALSQQLGVKAILNQQSNLTRTQQQIASGLRVLTPADDPAAAVRILDIGKSIEESKQFLSNIEIARSRLSLEEVTLTSATHVMQRVRELAVQGANETLTPSDHGAIEAEVRQALDELLGLANSQNANGEFLFSGFLSQTQPFTGTLNTAPLGFGYAGDGNQRMLQIGDARQIADGDHGITVFGDPAAGNSAFDVVAQFADNMGAATPDSLDIASIDQALERMITVRSSIGARINAVDQQQELNDDLILDMKTTLSEFQDLDYAEAISRMNLQATALQAAQQAFVRVQGLSLFNYL